MRELPAQCTRHPGAPAAVSSRSRVSIARRLLVVSTVTVLLAAPAIAGTASPGAMPHREPAVAAPPEEGRPASAIPARWPALAPQGPLQTVAAPRSVFEPVGRDGQVLIVVIDGLRGDLVSPETTPHLWRLVATGAATTRASTVQPSRTLPSITSMVTGLRPRDHGIVWNSHRPGRGNVEASTIFDVARQAGLHTAIFAGKAKLHHMAPPDALVCRSIGDRPDAIVAREAGRHLEEHRPHLMLVHLPGVDRAGHAHGWGSVQQLQALRSADVLLGHLVARLDTRTGERRALVIVTADHGGEQRSHGARRSVNTSVPWVAWQAGASPLELPTVSVRATAAAALEALGLKTPRAMEESPGRRR